VSRLGDAWRQDDAFDALYGAHIPAPPGFRVKTTSFWRDRFGDATRHQLSLQAEGNDISGLSQLAPNAVWLLDMSHRHVDDADFDSVCRFDQLEELNMAHTRITDAAASAMHTLQELRWLSVASCAITNVAIEHFAGLRALEHLDIQGTRVTDEGLRSLAFHPALRVLSIRESAITGEALAPLLTVPELRQIWMTHHQHRRAHRFIDERPEVEILY
jgi:Leucine-rich repeat (LRR) protein